MYGWLSIESIPPFQKHYKKRRCILSPFPLRAGIPNIFTVYKIKSKNLDILYNKFNITHSFLTVKQFVCEFTWFLPKLLSNSVQSVSSKSKCAQKSDPSYFLPYSFFSETTPAHLPCIDWPFAPAESEYFFCSVSNSSGSKKSLALISLGQWFPSILRSHWTARWMQDDTVHLYPLKRRWDTFKPLRRQLHQRIACFNSIIDRIAQNHRRQSERHKAFLFGPP